MITVAFFGSHPLGEECLRRLDESADVAVEVVVTYPAEYDSWWEGSVHELARERDLEVLTLEEERDMLDYDVDYLLSVYYPNILGSDLLDHPTELALNLHQAELPRYRGSNVFSHAIMNAREDDYWQYGTTIHVMEEEVDAGDVVDREFVPIEEDDTARGLYERTREASVRLFERTLPKIVSGEVHGMRTPQSEFDGARYFYTKDSLDGEKEIPPDRLADRTAESETYDRIRGLEFYPFEPAYTVLDDHRVYLLTDPENYGG